MHGISWLAKDPLALQEGLSSMDLFILLIIALLIVILLSYSPDFFSMAQQPVVGHGLLIIEASRSHSDTPQTSAWQHK
jgi:hypothetical protein